jgi:hypothetical protein
MENGWQQKVAKEFLQTLFLRFWHFDPASALTYV